MTPTQINKSLAQLEPLREKANKALEEYIVAAEELSSEIEDEIGEHSERWIDGEKGSAYQELADELNQVAYSEITEVPDFNY